MPCDLREVSRACSEKKEMSEHLQWSACLCLKSCETFTIWALLGRFFAGEPSWITLCWLQILTPQHASIAGLAIRCKPFKYPCQSFPLGISWSWLKSKKRQEDSLCRRRSRVWAFNCRGGKSNRFESFSVTGHREGKTSSFDWGHPGHASHRTLQAHFNFKIL